MSSSAANKPAELEAQFKGETRSADGYQYWTTSQEDEEAIDFGEMAERADQEPAPKHKKRQRKLAPGAGRRTLIRFASLSLILIVAAVAYLGFGFYQVYDAAGNDETRQADAIVVLGAAQFDGSPSPVFQERLDHAYNLWKSGQAPTIITTGSNQEGDRFTEGYAGYTYLLGREVPDDALVSIVDGGDTWEQLSASALQIENLDLGPVLLVSDSYHNHRLLDIADEVGIEAFVSPTAVDPTIGNYMRETIAVSIGRVTGYRRLSSFTSEN